MVKGQKYLQYSLAERRRGRPTLCCCERRDETLMSPMERWDVNNEESLHPKLEQANNDHLHSFRLTNSLTSLQMSAEFSNSRVSEEKSSLKGLIITSVGIKNSNKVCLYNAH